MEILWISAEIAILLTTALPVFFDWVPTTLNRNITSIPARDRLGSTFVHSGMGFVLFACCTPGFPPYASLCATVWYALMLGSGIRNWWIPYFAGKYPGEITAASYSKEYSRNLTILPRRDERPVTPDLQHTLVHLAALLATIATFFAAFTRQ